MKCIFCDEELTDATKPEHILLVCLGGRKETRRVDCSHHNERFGETIDKQVGEQVRILRNMLQLESGTGKSPPQLKNVAAGSEMISFDSKGKPTLAGKPFVITQRPDGNHDVQIVVNSPEQLQAIVPHLAARLRMPEDKLRDAIANGLARMILKRPGTVHYRLSFGGPLSNRSAVKSVLVLWALKVGNDELKSSLYDNARDFVLSGIAAFDGKRTYEEAKKFLDETPHPFNKDGVHLDSRHLPISEELVKRFGPFFNLIYVASDANGRVIGHFTLYNLISWQMVLAEKGGTPSAKIGLASNPLDPGKWSEAIAEELPIDFAWLDSPNYTDEFVRSRERVTRAVQHHVERNRSEEIERIIRDVFEKNGIGEGDAVKDETTKQKVFNEIAARLTKHVLNIPHEETLTPEQVKKMLDKPNG